MNVVLQNAVDAVSLGSFYALIALGLALTFSVMGLVNFAHGELIMVGAYAMVALQGAPIVLMVPLAVMTACVFALLMERLAFRPVRGANPGTLLVTSFALSYLLQNLALFIFGPLAKGVELPGFVEGFTQVGSLRVSQLDLVTVAVAVVLVGALTIFLRRTALGIQMRAAAEDFRMAQLLGVRPNNVIALAFLLSGFLAAVAGLVLLANTGTASPAMGLQPVLIAFVAAVVGGLGSIPGAAVGGFSIGCISTTLDAALPPDIRPYRDALLFGLVIVTLLFRPHGLFPSKTQYARV